MYNFMQFGRKELLTAVDCIRIGMDGMREKSDPLRLRVRRQDQRQAF